MNKLTHLPFVAAVDVANSKTIPPIPFCLSSNIQTRNIIQTAYSYVQRANNWVSATRISMPAKNANRTTTHTK
jgi:hypothetical protein